MTAQLIKNELLLIGSPQKAEHAAYFFKTGKGQYGEGDRFIGCTVPETRSIAKAYRNISFDEIEKLLDDEMHECRLCGLILLVEQFKKANAEKQKSIFDFYCSHIYAANSWDLVDLSAPYIVGEWLFDKNRAVLYDLAGSRNLWKERISVVSTLAFIRKNDFADTLRLSSLLFDHPHDLMHKACGWMLREVGKRDELVLTEFLDQYYRQMPRTMLRYAIERFSPEKRIEYMKR